MDPVRPSFPQTTQTPQTGGGDAARLAAQKAFFDMAMGRAQAPQPATAAPAPVVALTTGLQPSRAVQRIPEAGAEPPQKVLRPGSLLDIRV